MSPFELSRLSTELMCVANLVKLDQRTCFKSNNRDSFQQSLYSNGNISKFEPENDGSIDATTVIPPSTHKCNRGRETQTITKNLMGLTCTNASLLYDIDNSNEQKLFFVFGDLGVRYKEGTNFNSKYFLLLGSLKSG